MKKLAYEAPMMFAETFVANQYVAACKEPAYNITETLEVKCTSAGHDNKAWNTMFTDSMSACLVKFNPGVGNASGDKFYTQFEACAYVVGCNRQKWNKEHPYQSHVMAHGTPYWGDSDMDGFIMHDTVIDLSFAEKYQLS